MEEEKKSSKSKKVKCWVYGIGSAAVSVAGGVIMVLGGPVGMAVGGVILGSGLSGEVGTIQQALNKQEEFDQKQLWVQVAVGAAGGAIAAPIAAGGGALAAAVTNTAGRVSIQVASASVGGALSGAGS